MDDGARHAAGGPAHPLPGDARRLDARRGRRRRRSRRCARAGACDHFSRKGIAEYNRKQGAFKAKTKHGNYNAWVDRARATATTCSCPSTPTTCRCRTTPSACSGTSATPTSAFVVGPQCYANDDDVRHPRRGVPAVPVPLGDPARGQRLRRRDAGRHQQRRAHRARSGCIGGLVDSITEDMATGLAIHSRRNPDTGGAVEARSTRPTSSPSVRARRRGATTSASRCAGRGAPSRCS